MTERSAPSVQMPLEQVAPEERAATLGALLFVASEPVPVTVLAQHLGCTPAEARAALQALAARLDAVGLLLQWCGEDQVQVVSHPRHARPVQRFLGLERTVRLSQAALETLAIIAYRQPITRGELDLIRGVDSSGVLQTLLARGLIEPVGRLAAPGTPIQYGTTPEFLRFFGLTSLADLPPLPAELAGASEEG
ncbi:MAG: SMC-Scp complex subunit ScpB [Sphaerobacter sp.]|nr:SMC-Scp complex subunit ScpB [Sphaerobacter sp.]